MALSRDKNTGNANNLTSPQTKFSKLIKVQAAGHRLIPTVKTTKLLVVYNDNHLTWKTQISHDFLLDTWSTTN